MQRSTTPIVQFFFCHQYITGLVSGYLLATVLAHFQFHQPPRSIPACPEKLTDALISISIPAMKENRSDSYASVSSNSTMNISNTSEIVEMEVPVKRQRILCWVVTNPKNKIKAEAVNNTWGRRCDKLLFMSSQNDSSLPVVGLPIGEESRQQLWNKAKMTLRYVYNNHLNDYDWFFKADDDTYAVMENMRTLLSSYNSSLPLFIGHEFGQGTGRFLSGGAGYVMTREALRLLVEKGLDQNICPTNYKGEEDDVTITQCLGKLGAIVPNTTDAVGHHRFLSCSVEQYFNSEFIRCKKGEWAQNCLSDEPVTLHYVSGNQMLMYEYLIYQMKINLTRRNL